MTKNKNKKQKCILIELLKCTAIRAFTLIKSYTPINPFRSWLHPHFIKSTQLLLVLILIFYIRTLLILSKSLSWWVSWCGQLHHADTVVQYDRKWPKPAFILDKVDFIYLIHWTQPRETHVRKIIWGSICGHEKPVLVRHRRMLCINKYHLRCNRTHCNVHSPSY